MPIGLVVSTLLPIILSMLGSGLATFRALPRANQVERLKAALSSNAFWAAGPVAVAAARTAARSDATLNALVAAIGMGGGTALTVAGAAATAKYGVKTNGVHIVKKRRKNCGGDCGCAPCQSARANPTSMAFRNNRANPAGVGYGVAALLGAAGFVAGAYAESALGLTQQFKGRKAAPAPAPAPRVLTTDAEWDSEEGKRQGQREYSRMIRGTMYYILTVKDLSSRRGTVAYLDRGDGTRIKPPSGHEAFSTLAAAKKAAEADAATRQNPTSMAFRNRAIRNHHIRVGGAFYTPGGRKGTVLAESRGGYYRVRWSDGTLGSVRDTEETAYPTEGSRANPAHSLFSRPLLTFESQGTFEGSTAWWINAGNVVIGELSRQRPFGRSGLRQFSRQSSLPYEWHAEIDGAHLTIPDGSTLTDAKKIVIAAYARKNPNGAIPASLRRKL